MLAMVLAWLALLNAQEANSVAPSAPQREMVRTYDFDHASRCMGNMIGFRNVMLKCVVGADDRLGECELVSDSDAARRHRRVFFCMAGAVRVRYADGASAAGEEVRFIVNGNGMSTEREFEAARRAAEADAP